MTEITQEQFVELMCMSELVEESCHGDKFHPLTVSFKLDNGRGERALMFSDGGYIPLDGSDGGIAFFQRYLQDEENNMLIMEYGIKDFDKKLMYRLVG